MMAAVKNWWAGTNPRERRLLTVAAVLTILLSLWLCLRGLDTWVEGAVEQRNAAIARAARIEAKLSLIKAPEAPAQAFPAGPLSDGLLLSAAETGLTLTQNEPRGDAGSAVGVASAKAPALIGWLGRLEASGLVIEQAALTPRADGTVSLTAEVRRP